MAAHARARLLVPIIHKGAEAAQRFLRILVDGDIDNRIEHFAHTRHGSGFVDMGVDLVLRIHIDNHHFVDFAFAELAVNRIAGIHFGAIQQAAQAEVVGEATVKQMDIAAVGVFVGFEAAADFALGLALQPVMIGRRLLRCLADLHRQSVAAIAAIVVECERCKQQRHGAGSRHGARQRQIGKIQTHRVEIFLCEIEPPPLRHIGGADHGKRAFAARGQIAERGLAKQAAFKLLLQQITAAEFGRAQARQVGKRKHLLGHLALEILL